MSTSSWVTNRFEPAGDVPVDLLEEWIAESFRAVAPKKMLVKMDGLTGQSGSAGV